MEDRLTQCLNEIIYADDCPSELRQVLANVLILNEDISAYDATGFEEYFESSDFSDSVYELFGVDLGEQVSDEVPIDEVTSTIYDGYKGEATFEQAVDLVIEQLEDMGYVLDAQYTEADVIKAVSRYNWL